MSASTHESPEAQQSLLRPSMFVCTCACTCICVCVCMQLCLCTHLCGVCMHLCVHACLGGLVGGRISCPGQAPPPDAKKDPATRAAVLGTLATVAEAQPALFAACATDFVAVVSGETDPVALQFGLRALAFAAAHLSQDAAAQQRLWKRLRAWGLEGEPAVRKLALRCARAVAAVVAVAGRCLCHLDSQVYVCV